MDQTPVKTNLRRQTLLQQAIAATPLRKSAIHNPVVFIEQSNDESERNERRSLAEVQRRISNIQPSLNESTKFVGEQEMKDHFQICTKLFTENKITPKNAWQLHIIDLLKQMAQKTSGDTLQMASTSLDISAKVYGIRVDDIHSDGLKLASSMARVSEKETPQAMDDDAADDDPEKEQAGAKKKKKKRRLLAGEKNTISKDPKSLIAPLPKLESVFFSTRIDADASATDNLFTNTLKMNNSGYKYMLLSKDKAWADTPDPVLANKRKYPFAAEPLHSFKLCVPFNDFCVDEWDPDEEEKQLAIEKSQLTQRENEVVYDDNGYPIAELDGSVHDIFSNDGPGDHDVDMEDDIVEEQEFCAQIQGEIAHIVDFRPEEVHQRSEYSYNNLINSYSGKFIDQLWAGPSHWKVKYIKRSLPRFSGQVNDTGEKQIVNKQQKRKKKPEKVLYTEEDEQELLKYDLTKILKTKKKSHSVDPQKITLPETSTSSLKFLETISELMCKPGTAPMKKLDTTNENNNNQDDYEFRNYNYENPNDSQYCSQQNDDDDGGAIDNDMPMDDNFDNEEIAAVAAQQNFLGENLIDVPELVPKSYVPYALQAKKMDMKKLKTAVWQTLTKISQKDTQIRDGTVHPTTFSKMYNDVPKLLNEKMKSELSCPLAFVALLHLCNEQNLKLTQLPGYKDFNITGPARSNIIGPTES